VIAFTGKTDHTFPPTLAVSTQAPFSDAARTATRKVLDVLDPFAHRRATDLSTECGSSSDRALPVG